MLILLCPERSGYFLINKILKINYLLSMNIKLKFFTFLFSLFFSISNIYVKPIKANEYDIKVKEALGFMIGGDGGWKSFSSFHEIQGCKVTYHQTFMGMKLIVDYDFDKVIWKSASTKEIEGKTFFTLNGEVVAQTLKALSLETNEDLSNGLFIFGLIGGASSQIIFPILTEISRFENALIDLSEICQGIKTKY